VLAHRRASAVVLALVCALGVGARCYRLGTPAPQHGHGGTVFDETYYVNAARVIAGAHMNPGDRYYGAAPAGSDPNAEHPQLAKVLIALSIDLGGDTPVAWRISAVVFSLAALLMLNWLVRCAGGGPWLAVGATAIASFENLWVVSGRIAVLDIYCVPFMLAGAAFYLRRRPVIAGFLLGIGACFKEVALFGVLILLGLEAMRGAAWLASQLQEAPQGWRSLGRSGWPRIARPDRRRVARPLAMVLVTIVTFASALAIIDSAVPPNNGGHPVTRNEAAICSDLWLWRSACNHIAFIVKYAEGLRSPNAPQGIASYPWQFWGDVKNIPYFTQTVSVRVAGELTHVTTTINFQGLISRVLLFTSWPAILMSIWWAIRRRDDLSFLVIAWILGTWLPIEFGSLFEARTTYLYYMVITMPALYIAVARLLAWQRVPKLLDVAWWALFLVEFATLYPLRTLG
jgi:hypothetical protein